MTDPNIQRDPRATRRGRVFAALLFAIAVIPVVLATWMYFGGWGATGGEANKGELLQPVGAVAEFELLDLSGQPLEQRFRPFAEEPRWLILTLAERCDSACQEALHSIHQVHVALGRERDRVERAFWSSGNEPGLTSEYPELQLLKLPAGKPGPSTLPGVGAAGLEKSYQIYIVDPNGNVILRYDRSNSGEDLLDDLKTLLRLSNIG